MTGTRTPPLQAVPSETPAIKRLGTAQTRAFGTVSPPAMERSMPANATLGPDPYIRSAGAKSVPYGTPGRG